MKGFRLVLLTIVVSLLCAPPALADPTGEKEKVNKRAAGHYHRGSGLFQKGDHRQALVEFSRAYKLDPRPEMLFNIGLCHHRLGNMREALESYGRYIQQKPDAKNYDKIRTRILELAQQFAVRHEAALNARKRRAGKPASPALAAPPPGPGTTQPQPPGAEAPAAPADETKKEPAVGGDDPGQAPAPVTPEAPTAEAPAAEAPVAEAPAAEAPASAPASMPASLPTDAPGHDSSPYWSPDPVAHRGLVLRFHVGPSGDVGSGATTDQLGVGYGLGLAAGFQFRLGRRHGIAPEIAFGYSDWGFIDGTYLTVNGQAIPITGGVGMLTVLAGARYSLYLGRIDLWGSAHFGYGSLSVSLVNKNDTTDKADSSEGGFGLDMGVGANFMILRYLGAGLYMRVNKVVADMSGVDGTGFSLGLNLLGKLPL